MLNQASTLLFYSLEDCDLPFWVHS